ncbi:ribonuclease E [Caudoviricetes sp.]|nr:ribonuclease E [Caudoviricetes sp.]
MTLFKVRLVAPVPPLATGSVPETCVVKLTPDSVPPKVRLPEVVTLPVRVMPLTVPVPPTEVTVPVPPTEMYSTSVSPTFTASTLPEFVAKLGKMFVRAAAAVLALVPPFAIGRVPVIPVDRGRPVALVRVAEVGVPRIGVTNVGLVANTKAPLPVSSVTAVAKLELEGVARKVAIPAPRPLTPDAIGNPVALVRIAEDGVPSAGVTSVGLVANTKEPLPVSLVTAAAKLALDGVSKKVATPAPNDVIPVPPLATGSVPVTPLASGNPVALVRTAADGVPSAGVTKVGLLANTSAPLPVSSEITPASSAEVVAECTDNLSVVTTSVLDAGIDVPFNVLVPVAVKEVTVAAAGVEAPIMVASMVPALMSAEAMVAAVLTVKLVTVAAAGVEAPITVASIVPALMSAVSATKLSMFATPSMCKSLN